MLIIFSVMSSSVIFNSMKYIQICCGILNEGRKVWIFEKAYSTGYPELRFHFEFSLANKSFPFSMSSK